MMRRWRGMMVVVVLAGLLPLLPVGVVVADDAVVSAPCSEGDFDTALDTVQTTGGGTITFECGGAVVIPITGQKVIDSDVTIDGDGQVTFAGDGDNRLFEVDGDASLELVELTLENGSAGDGGAILNNGTVTVTASTFSGNSAGDDGGAISNNATLTVTASTFSGNSADDDGGAIYNSFGTLTVAASILANSPSGNNCVNFGTLTSNGYTLSDDDSCGFGSIGDIEDGDANLAALTDNGGPTQTMLPQAPSDALEAIPAADCLTYSTSPDQRGVTRPQGDCEIGAVEIQQTVTLCGSYYTGAVTVPAAGSGCPSGSVPLVVPGPSPTTFCINPYTTALLWSPGGSCAASYWTHIVPDDGPLSYCQHNWTGKLNYSATGQCGAYETAGVIPG